MASISAQVWRNITKNNKNANFKKTGPPATKPFTRPWPPWYLIPSIDETAMNAHLWITIVGPWLDFRRVAIEHDQFIWSYGKKQCWLKPTYTFNLHLLKMGIFSRGPQKVHQGLRSCSRLLFYFIQYNFDTSEYLKRGSACMRKSRKRASVDMDKSLPE